MKAIVLVAASCLLLPHPALAQVTIERVMTVQEYHDAGIDQLSGSQRAALNRWLNRYTAQLRQPLQTSARPSSPSASYGGVGGGHWIKEKSSGGRVITLEDGSVWEISSIDRIYTALWLPLSEITVLEAKQAVGEFKYLLVNTDDGEKALAKHLGR